MATPNKAQNKAAGREKKETSIPDHVKQPNDHQPAKEDVKGPQSYTVTWPLDSEEPHEYVIEGESLDDVELLEYFTDDNFVGALRVMLGAKQWNEFKENSRDPKTGRAKATDASEFLNHVLAVVKRKNS